MDLKKISLANDYTPGNHLKRIEAHTPLLKRPVYVADAGVVNQQISLVQFWLTAFLVYYQYGCAGPLAIPPLNQLTSLNQL